MASLQPPGAMPIDNSDTDPFAPTPSDASLRQRYATFDANAFSLYSNGSPAQARRALEAHLAETERRLQEASQLGSRLVSQRSDLASKLNEVQERNDGEDLDPQLRQRLVELEREFNEVGKETARAFLPKGRVPSNESQRSNDGLFETGARDSPSKAQPPNLSSRKQRNQAPAKVNDLKLATEIGSSLLNQVRDLQAAYAEKDEALKHALANKSQLETDMEGLVGRLRSLDESEQRYKDENWNLETRLQELAAATKAAADREAKLNQHVNATKTGKASMERELEELKQAHGKLNEDHRLLRKQHETEVSSLQRNATSVETERGTLQQKIQDLTSQNQELAKAMAYKLHATNLQPTRELTPEEDDLNAEMGTPEHSPPPSPTKGTPRHGGLESETLKSSLHHAHRMIQNLKNNIHREKTEKLEIRRMLQDARNELEERRADGGSGAKKRNKSRDELKEFKKPARPDRLGGARGSTTDISMQDEDWEDHDGAESPSRAAAGRANIKTPGVYADTTDVTETENSDDFETATEHEAGNGTETDAFHTGAESLTNSSDDLTETEAEPSKRQRSTQDLRGHARVQSWQSTASTSGEEEQTRTPASQSMRSRFSRSMRGRNSTRGAGVDGYRDSPASFVSETPSSASTQTTPAGPSLFTELADLEDDDDASVIEDGTPSRSLASHQGTPDVQRKISPLALEQSAVLAPSVMAGDEVANSSHESAQAAAKDGEHQTSTVEAQKKIAELEAQVEQLQARLDEAGKAPADDDKVEAESPEHDKTLLEKGAGVVGAVLTGGLGFGLGRASKGTEDTEAGADAESMVTEPAHLSMSNVVAQDIEPVDAVQPVVAPTPLTTSVISSQYVEPKEAATTPFSASAISSQHVEPKETAYTPFATSSISTRDTEPRMAAAAPFAASAISSQATEPHAPKVAPFTSSAVSALDTEPQAPQTPARAPFATSGINALDTEPKTPAQTLQKPVTPFTVSQIIQQYSEEPLSPVPAEHDSMLPAAVAGAAVGAVAADAVDNEATPKPSFERSSISQLDTEPREAPAQAERPSTATHSAIVGDPAFVAPSSTDSVATQTTPKASRVERSGVDVPPIPRVPSDSAATQTTPKVDRAQRSIDESPTKSAKHNKPGFLGFLGLGGRTKSQQSEPAIAEDETSPPAPATPSSKDRAAAEPEIIDQETPRPAATPQPLRVYADDVDAALPGLENAREPMREIQPNQQKERAAMLEGIELAKSLRVKDTTDSSMQTIVSSEDMDNLLKRKPESLHGTALVSPSMTSPVRIPSSPTRPVYGAGSPRKSRESILAADSQKVMRRPGSSGSVRSRAISQPPLPPDHKQAIAAAAQRGPGVPAFSTAVVPTGAPQATSSTPGQMGPPIMPASAYRQAQTYRPGSSASHRGHGGITATTRTSIRGMPPASGVSSPVTRRSSVSSFASEIDQRFNITRANLEGFENATDPRMIQAITQTMIGEFLWKYTRKPGREAQSSTRHRRFFWVHPYTRTLYWSEQNPATAGRAQLKAKSVRIQAVRVVSDENPLPPGLHRKSLVVVTPGREIMFTAQTGGRHETWFNALSYLLLRSTEEREEAVAATNDDLTAEDVDEFNPRSGIFGGSTSKLSRRSRTSVTSYNTRRSSVTREYPTLTPNDRSIRGSEPGTARRSQSQAAPHHRASISNRLSSIAGSITRGSFNSRHSTVVNGGDASGSSYARSEGGTTVTGTDSIYDASVVRSSHDSAEDLRRVIERQEKDADRLENVRACCDGKHDVGSLSHRGKHSAHRHSTPAGPSGSTNSRHARSATQIRAEA